MRHAKAEPFGSTDHVRALTDRGRADAAAAGRWLADLGMLPTHALVSTAARTRETWAAVEESSGAKAAVSFDDVLYHGGVDAAVEALQVVDPGAETVMFVGHNPTAAYLGHFLDDGEGDEASISGMLRGFPAGAVVVFEIATTWDDVRQESGRVVAFHAP